MPKYSGLWTRTQQMQAKAASIWPLIPGAPTIGTATAGPTSASVTFTAPSNLGIPAVITSYTVTASPGGVTGTGASSPVTVSGLTNGTAYTFTVSATNAAGTGPSSAASNSVTPIAALPTSVSVIAVAGGGGGGGNHGGGGGAGGYLTGTYAVSASTSYTVTIGGGGTPCAPGVTGTNGSNTVFATATAIGGGRSGSYNVDIGALTGGSGGGGPAVETKTAGRAATQGASGGLTGYGFAGGNGVVNQVDWPGGGGGGAGAVGANATNAGNGGNGGIGRYDFDYTFRAGGGGGGGWDGHPGYQGAGGQGGGASGNTGSTPPAAATANTGGGGGGGRDSSGSAGGSGIVVIQYLNSLRPATTTGSPTIVDDGTNVTYYFNSSGTISW